MTERENYLRTVRFETPDHIPMGFHINSASWNHYPQDALQELMVQHPKLFPGYVKKEKVVPYYSVHQRKDEPFTDDWGCFWETTENGITGTVTRHPLAEDSAFDTYVVPDPETRTGDGPRDWKQTAESIQRAKKAGELTQGGLGHGHTFLRLCDIRGYQNLMFDMVDENPKLNRLIEQVEAFNFSIVNHYMALGVDVMGYAEDLGMQVGPMLSPEHFVKYIKPSYQRLMAPARKAGCIVHMHSDGDIRSLVDDLIDGGVEVLNLQDLVNGIDWIAQKYAGKVCIDLDIDRQSITARGTPKQIDALIREEVEKLASKKGGLTMIYGLYPGVPLANVKALMDAMERYMGYYS